MRAILFGLTFTEKALYNQSVLSWKMTKQLTRFASSFSSARSSTRINKNFTVSSPDFVLSFRPPRYFSRGALDQDTKRNPTPFLQLLTETNEVPQIRPIPRNRLLLRTLCRGKGTLRQNSQGHAYLDVDNQFILALLPYLRSQGLVRAPYFNLFGSPDGAHIPVIPSREAIFQDLGPISEIGMEFTFDIDGLYSMKDPTVWPEVEEVWFFNIKSPELEKIRRKYFLSSLPGGHAFIIALAVKPALQQRPVTGPIYHISPVVRAA